MIKYIKSKRELNKCFKKGIKVYTENAYDDTYFLQIDTTIIGFDENDNTSRQDTFTINKLMDAKPYYYTRPLYKRVINYLYITLSDLLARFLMKFDIDSKFLWTISYKLASFYI